VPCASHWRVRRGKGETGSCFFCLGAETLQSFITFICDRSSTGRPDWTCIVVGFTSGYVRFYTEVSWVSSSRQLADCRAVHPPDCLMPLLPGMQVGL
jgi:hypothetical protein